jgi:hypothetical protein
MATAGEGAVHSSQAAAAAGECTAQPDCNASKRPGGYPSAARMAPQRASAAGPAASSR